MAGDSAGDSVSRMPLRRPREIPVHVYKSNCKENECAGTRSVYSAGLFFRVVAKEGFHKESGWSVVMEDAEN